MKKLFTTFMILVVAAITMAAGQLLPAKAISLITGKEMPFEKMVPTQRDVETTDAGATSTCYIGYHWTTSPMATISITSVSTGNVMDKFYVTDSAREDEVVGRIEVNVSKYPNGDYIVSFTPASTGSKQASHTTKKLIGQH